MQRLFERAKMDVGLVPQTVNNTNVSGRFYAGKNFRRALGIMQVGALAATKTCQLQLMEATDSSGTGAQAITNASAIVTANANVTELTIALATVTAGQTITINGLTFTAHASATTVANREFSIAGTDTQDGDALVTCINDATYGVPGVTASNNAGTLTLRATDTGATLITASSAAGTVTIATTQAQAYVEVDGLALSSGFTHIGCKVTSTGNGAVGVTLLRSEERDVISQKVAASAAA